MAVNAKNAYKEEFSDEKFIFSTADTCDFFGISRETLSSWHKKGAPKAARGKWNLKALLNWRYKSENKESPQLRKLRAEADLKEAKAKQEQIKLGVTKDEFLPVYEVREDLTLLMTNLKKSLLAIGHNVAIELNSLDADAAEVAKTEVDKRVHEALEELSKGGTYHRKRKKKATL